MDPTASNWRRVATSATMIVLALYLPFAWVLWAAYPWTEHRLLWLKLWPILPGFVPGFWLFHPHDVVEFTTMGVCTLLFVLGLTWVAARGTRKFIVLATGLALLISIPSAIIAYAALRA